MVRCHFCPAVCHTRPGSAPGRWLRKAGWKYVTRRDHGRTIVVAAACPDHLGELYGRHDQAASSAPAGFSSRRSCACGDFDLADDDQLVELLGWLHGSTACLRTS